MAEYLPPMHSETEYILRQSKELSGESRNAELYHFLRELLDAPQVTEFLESSGTDKRSFIDDLDELIDGCDVRPPVIGTPRVADLLDRSQWRAARTGASAVYPVDALHLIVEKAQGLRPLFDKHAITLSAVARYRAKMLVNEPHGMPEVRPVTALKPEPDTRGNSSAPAIERIVHKGGDALQAYCTNLNERALGGKFNSLIGRDAEVERVAQILGRYNKSNPLLIGEPGVGKTAIVEGLAKRIVDGNVPPNLREATIFSLDMGLLVAGTKYRGDFEERVTKIIKEIQDIPDAILFIDEIHMLIGLGATRDNTNDASNLLKPALANGTLRCIGATTYTEYRHITSDPALVRRFNNIDIPEPSVEDTINILKGLKAVLESHHKVRYRPEAIRAAAELSAKHINGRRFPDKAIDVLDEAGASRPPGARVVTVKDIEATVARIARIPPKTVSHDEIGSLWDLDARIKRKVFGQDSAVNELTASFKLSRAGLNDPDKPLGSYLFTGPTGVGKTELAKQLATEIGIPFIRFDMSEYMEQHAASRLIGAPPGYVGFDNGGLLTEAIDRKPHAVLLLDEIEKAHPDIYNILLQVMDYGKLTDNNGKTVDFRNVILIMTSNAGATAMSRPPIGFAREEREGEDQVAVGHLFSPEFRNRLDAIIPFDRLKPEMIGKVLAKFLGQLKDQTQEKGVSVAFTEAARNWLMERGYDPVLGARPLGRVIKEHIKKVLADEMLFGRLRQGGSVTVGVREGHLSFDFADAAQGQHRPAVPVRVAGAKFNAEPAPT